MGERGDVVTRKEQLDGREIDVYQVLIECRDEQEQREVFERLRQEGWKVRLLVL